MTKQPAPTNTCHLIRHKDSFLAMRTYRAFNSFSLFLSFFLSFNFVLGKWKLARYQRVYE